jgi:hypothetical protein
MKIHDQLDHQLGYKPVTVALVALYITLLAERDCYAIGEAKEALERFRSVSEMAATVQKSTVCDALYSIAAPGIGLRYCLTAVRHLYAAVELCADCPLCHGKRTVTEVYVRVDKPITKKCPCVTAVSAQLTIWKSCYQAALVAWMEWVGLDEDALHSKYGMETLEQNVLECIRWNGL